MPESSIPSTGGAAATGATNAPGAHHEINVQQLADKVYSLLLADARLSLARGEAPLPSTRKGES